MRADVILKGLDDLSGCFVFLEKAFNFVDSKTAESTFKLGAYGAR
jgi:hypothetical protein